MKIGLVLSGGGVRGMAHLGVMKALEEQGVKLSCIAGTSAGSIVGSLYAYGYKPDEILQIILSTSLLKSIRPAWRWTGLFSLEGLREVMLKHMPENNFESLKIPLTVVATDIQKAQPEYFSSGELIPTVLASCCIPGIFNPIEYNGRLYIDGGVVDNLPAKAIRENCDFLIGSHCNKLNEEPVIDGMKVVLERSLLLAIHCNVMLSKKMCDLVIEPSIVGTYHGFELRKAEEIYKLGYQHTKENFDVNRVLRKD